MKAESERYWELLERRLALLEALSKTLAESRADFIALDLEAIRGRIQQQEQFCLQIRALDDHITQAQIRCAQLARVPAVTGQIWWPAASPAAGATAKTETVFAARIQESLRRVDAAQGNLRRLNDAHQALLRRSQRAMHVLVNLFQSHAPNYAAPVAPSTGSICEERV